MVPSLGDISCQMTMVLIAALSSTRRCINATVSVSASFALSNSIQVSITLLSRWLLLGLNQSSCVPCCNCKWVLARTLHFCCTRHHMLQDCHRLRYILHAIACQLHAYNAACQMWHDRTLSQLMSASVHVMRSLSRTGRPPLCLSTFLVLLLVKCVA